MDVVILCGGKGTRLSEETVIKPKPMVEIGGIPILLHIMRIYSSFGFKRFILALGYKGDYIKQFFYNYRITSGDFQLKLDPKIEPVYFNHADEADWDITLVNTGLETLKGGRIKRIEKHIKSNSFHLTYGDGVSDVNLHNLVAFHDSHDGIGTVSAVHPPSRFGEMLLSGDNVREFEEKPQMGGGYINGGFFVFDKALFSYLDKDEQCDFEFGPLQTIAKEGGLKAYQHDGFWQCMDNVRERDYLNNLIKSKNAPWVVWGN